MGVGVGVNQIPVGMKMGMGVGMVVGVLQGDGVLHHQHRGADHNQKTNIEGKIRLLPEQHHAEQHPKEGGKGIVGAGFGSPQLLLGLNVKVDAKAIGHKPQGHGTKNPLKLGKFLLQKQCHQKTSQSGENSLDGGNLHGGLVAQHPGAVVFQTPAAGSCQNQQRAGAKPQTVRPFKAQNEACPAYQGDGGYQSPGKGLPEKQPGDERGRHNFKIPQKGSIGRMGGFQPQHEQDGSGDVQHHHPNGVGQLLPGQVGSLFPGYAPIKKQTNPRPQIQKGRHHGRAYLGEEQLAQRDIQSV